MDRTPPAPPSSFYYQTDWSISSKYEPDTLSWRGTSIICTSLRGRWKVARGRRLTANGLRRGRSLQLIWITDQMRRTEAVIRQIKFIFIQRWTTQWIIAIAAMCALCACCSITPVWNHATASLSPPDRKMHYFDTSFTHTDKSVV